MFFEDDSQIVDIYKSNSFSVIAIKTHFTPTEKQSVIIEPEKNNQITIDQIRDIIDLCKVKRTSPFYIFIQESDRMNEKAQNSFLKLLEEPSENYHICLFTSSASALLPTILSRANLYIKRIKNPLESSVEADEDIKKYAKRIIAAKDRDLPIILKDLTLNKDYKKDSRKYALQVVETAIEIAYKSFFATKNSVYLKKLPNMITLYDNLNQNGHIKLHLIADLC